MAVVLREGVARGLAPNLGGGGALWENGGRLVVRYRAMKRELAQGTFSYNLGGLGGGD